MVAKNAPPPSSRSLRLGLSEVWVRFLFAIVGLVLAFGAALFSTISRESGSVWGTIVLASAALLLAAFVGLTTVPYLARRVVAARVREAMDYEVTRAGIIYVLITIVIGIAAINTGNNLLYVIVASLLSAIVVSGIASAAVLRALQLDVLLPEHVFAGRPMIARLLLRNSSSWMPSFSVRVVPAKRKPAQRWRWEAYTFGMPATALRTAVAAFAGPAIAPGERGSRASDSATCGLLSVPRAGTGTHCRSRDEFSGPRPLSGKELRAGNALPLPS